MNGGVVLCGGERVVRPSGDGEFLVDFCDLEADPLLRNWTGANLESGLRRFKTFRFYLQDIFPGLDEGEHETPRLIGDGFQGYASGFGSEAHGRLEDRGAAWIFDPALYLHLAGRLAQ